jgi:hypothetical protein
MVRTMSCDPIAVKQAAVQRSGHVGRRRHGGILICYRHVVGQAVRFDRIPA